MSHRKFFCCGLIGAIASSIMKAALYDVKNIWLLFHFQELFHARGVNSSAKAEGLLRLTRL